MTQREILTKKIVNSVWSNDIIFCELPTGYGKSFISIKIQAELTKNEPQYYTNGEMSRSLDTVYPKTLILVAEKAHIVNWMMEYKKHNYSAVAQNTTIKCYASIHKLKDTQWDMIIADEAHHLSLLRLSHLSTIKFNKMILLSATLKKSV